MYFILFNAIPKGAISSYEHELEFNPYCYDFHIGDWTDQYRWSADQSNHPENHISSTDQTQICD